MLDWFLVERAVLDHLLVGPILVFASLKLLLMLFLRYTPQALSTENRGFGNGLLMACGRLASLTAPFIATFADVTSPVPLFVSCGMYVVMGIIGLLLPFETSGFGQEP
jgi:hypothetical protein